MAVKDFLGQTHNRFFGRVEPGQKLAGGHGRSGRKAEKPENFQSHMFFSQEALQARINYLPGLVNASAKGGFVAIRRIAGGVLPRVRRSGLTLLFICTGVISIYPSPARLPGPKDLQF